MGKFILQFLLDSKLKFMKKFIAQFLPLGIVNLYYYLTRSRHQIESNNSIEFRIDLANKNFNGFINNTVSDVYNNSVSYLLKKGINSENLFGGSMPLDSINAIEQYLNSNCKSNKDEVLLGLHIGNFVGISLNCFTFIINKLSINSRVISIDPNINHRGIENPSRIVSELLHLNSLQNQSIIINGYSHEKSISNDGNTFNANYDPLMNYSKEFAPTNVINSLSLFLKNKISFVLIDGNHDVNYVTQELNDIKKLLAKDAIVILDDIDEKHWKGLFDFFNNIDSKEFEKQFSNGRIGILKYKL